MSTSGDDGIRRILCITLSCVGDVVMSTPVLQALHERYPYARIDVVADSRASQLLSRCSYVGEILHKDKKTLFRGAFGLLKRLRGRRYDLIVDLRTDGLTWLLRSDNKLTKRRARPYGNHSVERMMGVIRSLHGEAPIPPACVWLEESDRRYAGERLARLPQGLRLALAPGSAGARDRKAWPADNYAALANALQDQFSAVILAGGPDERSLTDAIAEKLTLPYIDATDTNLIQLAALLERCSLFVGSDSGPGHIAAAVGVPTLTLFGRDHRDCLPWGGRSAWLLADSGYARDVPPDEALAAARALANGQSFPESPNKDS